MENIAADKEFAVKQKYIITKDRQDGTSEIVWSKKCSETEAFDVFNKIVREQAHEFHVAKTLPMWRVIRMFNASGAQIAQES